MAAEQWVIWAEVTDPDPEQAGSTIATALNVGRMDTALEWYLDKAGYQLAAKRPSTGQGWPR